MIRLYLSGIPCSNQIIIRETKGVGKCIKKAGREKGAGHIRSECADGGSVEGLA